MSIYQINSFRGAPRTARLGVPGADVPDLGWGMSPFLLLAHLMARSQCSTCTWTPTSLPCYNPDCKDQNKALAGDPTSSELQLPSGQGRATFLLVPFLPALSLQLIPAL